MGFFKGLEKMFKGVLGLDSGKDLAKAQQAELDRLEQASKLDASQEAQQVAQFDDLEGDTFTGTDTRRKKNKTGNMYGNPLGVSI